MAADRDPFGRPGAGEGPADVDARPTGSRGTDPVRPARGRRTGPLSALPSWFWIVFVGDAIVLIVVLIVVFL
ncbi:MAG: hypothetical protein AB7G37_12115 [Solirubrobacteraceae bacterium]